MIAQEVFYSLAQAWESLPMPVIFLYAVALGMIWLYAEYLATRTARATPGWRRPLPVIPWISEVIVWGVRGSTWSIWLWIILYLVLVSGILFERFTGSSAIVDALSTPLVLQPHLMRLGRIWMVELPQTAASMTQAG